MIPRTLARANKWRASYNPLRGLTLQTAVSLLEGAEQGRLADLQWTYRFMEKRDATLRALVQLRTSAIKKLDWDIRTADDSAAAKAQAEALRAAYDGITNLKAAVSALALAEFRGYAHLEKRYRGDDPAQPLVALVPVPQWHWAREDAFGPFLYNHDAANTNRGTPIEAAHFVIREVERPINEIALICYLRKNLSQKDWDGFVETYGIPPLFITLPANVPSGKEDEYQAMAEAVIGDLRGTLPNGAEAKTLDSGARGINPFRDHLSYQEEQLVLAGTSGKLTMLNGPTGLGGGQSEVHQNTFDELAQAEAAEISEIFQAQLDRAILAAKFPGAPVLAYFELAARDQTDVGQVLDHAVKAAQAGFALDPAELSEKTGYKLTLTPKVAAAPGGFGAPATSFNRASPLSPLSPDAEALRRSSMDRLAKAIEKDLAPLREAVTAALALEDDAKFDEAMTALKAQLPSILKKAGASGETATAYESILGASLVNGLARGGQATANRTAPQAIPITINMAAPPPVEITLNQPGQPQRRVRHVRDAAGRVTESITEDVTPVSGS